MIHMVTEVVHLMPTTLTRACSHQPSSQAYAKLIRDLVDAKAHQQHTGNVPEAAIWQLYAVLTFLGSNKDAYSAGLLEPLEAIARAAWDAAQGGKPALFAQSKRQTGAPSNQIRMRVPGILAGLVAVLMSAGQRRGKAIEIVAHEASRLGIKTTRGRRLEPKHVAEWYDETDSEARDLRAMFHNAVVERLGADVRREIGSGDSPAIAVRRILENIRGISD